MNQSIQTTQNKYITNYHTKLCTNSNCQYNENTCFDAHSTEYQRRSPYVNGTNELLYAGVLCSKQSLLNCTPDCKQSHSHQSEHLYHPHNYKTQWCRYGDGSATCVQLGDSCPFIHVENEIRVSNNEYAQQLQHRNNINNNDINKMPLRDQSSASTGLFSQHMLQSHIDYDDIPEISRLTSDNLNLRFRLTTDNETPRLSTTYNPYNTLQSQYYNTYNSVSQQRAAQLNPNAFTFTPRSAALNGYDNMINESEFGLDNGYNNNVPQQYNNQHRRNSRTSNSSALQYNNNNVQQQQPSQQQRNNIRGHFPTTTLTTQQSHTSIKPSITQSSLKLPPHSSLTELVSSSVSSLNEDSHNLPTSLVGIILPAYEQQHVDTDILNELPDHAMYIYGFRVSVCSAHLHNECPHDSYTCFNAHSRLPRRRKPQLQHGRFNYIPTRCRYVLDDKECVQSVHCRFAHVTEEVIYHPSKYKTQLCTHQVDSDGCCTGYGRHCGMLYYRLMINTIYIYIYIYKSHCILT